MTAEKRQIFVRWKRSATGGDSTYHASKRHLCLSPTPNNNMFLGDSFLYHCLIFVFYYLFSDIYPGLLQQVLVQFFFQMDFLQVIACHRRIRTIDASIKERFRIKGYFEGCGYESFERKGNCGKRVVYRIKEPERNDSIEYLQD